MTTGQLYELGSRAHQAGRLAEAEGFYRQVLHIDPDQPDTLHMLGLVAHQVGKHDVACALIERAITIRPDFVQAINNLGNVLMDLRDFPRAIAMLRRACALRPDLAECQSNLGNALKDIEDLDGAMEAYQRAVALRPDLPEANNNLGALLVRMGAPAEAITSFRRSQQLRPNVAEVHYNLGNALRELGRAEEAVAEYSRAIAIAPNYASARANRLLTLHSVPGMEPRRIAEEHRASAANCATETHANDRSPGRQLRIGYVSGDFRHHSVAFFLLPLLQAHAHSDFHVTCYSTSRQSDGVTEQFQACADAWVMVADETDEAVVKRIQDDRIDILVDLSGHTSGSRLGVFARKPAPVQVTYLGYPNTTGLSAIDWRLTDARADPAGADDLYTEKLWRLPRTSWCFSPLSGSPPTVLPDRRDIVFGSFNNMAKINDPLLGIWSRILERTPGSRLVMKTRTASSEGSRRELLARILKLDFDENRISFLQPDANNDGHLRSYEAMDVALDTFPYAGTTTTCEAMWMGVPVVTLGGSMHASRVGVSLLESVGLDDFVALDQEHYINIAVALAKSAARRRDLRLNLRSRMERSPLMDSRAFARDVESAFRAMWHAWVDATK